MKRHTTLVVAMLAAALLTTGCVSNKKFKTTVGEMTTRVDSVSSEVEKHGTRLDTLEKKDAELNDSIQRVDQAAGVAQRTGETALNRADEAAKLAKPILHGPNVWNFADIYAALDAARGAEEVENLGHMAQRVSDLLKDNAARKAIGEAGLRTVERLGGALTRTMSELEPYLLQLRLAHQADQQTHA